MYSGLLLYYIPGLGCFAVVCRGGLVGGWGFQGFAYGFVVLGVQGLGFRVVLGLPGFSGKGFKFEGATVFERSS